MKMLGNLRRIAIGAVVALSGVFNLGSPSPASATLVVPQTESASTIVNRVSKKAKLVLALPNQDGRMVAQHYSHSSHQSHSSHYSHKSHYSRTR